MARTALPVTPVPAAGLNLAAGGTAVNFIDGNSFPWAADRCLYVTNGDTTPLTVTVQTPGTVGSLALAVADAPFTVPASASRLLPVLGSEFRRPDGSVWVDWTGADAAVTCTVVEL